MSAAPTLSRADEAAWERALLDRQLERLDELADMAMALAGEIQRRATASDPDADITHAAIDFARVSRAVRMTLALQSRLVRDFKTPIKAGSAKAHNDDDDDGPIEFEAYWEDGTPITHAARRRVLRGTVESLAKDCGLEAETAERMETEALEALEREPIYPAPGNRPFHEFLAQICKDLGLKPMDASSPVERQRNGGFDPIACDRSDGPLKGVEGAGRISDISAERLTPPCTGPPPPPLRGSPPPQAGEDAGP